MDSPQAFLELSEVFNNLNEFVLVGEDFDSVELESALAGLAKEPKFRYTLIEWIAKSPNREVKKKRKEAVAKALSFKSVR